MPSPVRALTLLEIICKASRFPALLLIPAAFPWTTSTNDAVVDSENADKVASGYCAGGCVNTRQRRASGQTKDLFPSGGQEGIYQCHCHNLLFILGTLDQHRGHHRRLVL